jgi:hypothetical protein
MNFLGGQRTIGEGAFTQTIYGLIKDSRHTDAIEHLMVELQVRCLQAALMCIELRKAEGDP